MCEISFNSILEGETRPIDQYLCVDKRITIQELKKKISEFLSNKWNNLKRWIISIFLDISINEFKMCKNLQKHEYRDNYQTLEESGLVDGGVVLLEKGKPQNVDEYIINFFLYNIEKIEAWEPLFIEILSDSIKMEDLKKKIILKMNISENETIRLREKNGIKVGKILKDNLTLKENFEVIQDGKEIAIQKVTFLGKENILFYKILIIKKILNLKKMKC